MLTGDTMTDTAPESERIFASLPGAGDARGTRILAKTIYRELRNAGLSEREVLAIATELLSQTAADLKNSR